MEIFGVPIGAGEKVHRQIKVGELANGSPIYFPFMAVRGPNPGPVLWMCGAVHGDELNGLFAMRDVYLKVEPEELKGTIVFTPILNVLAFVERKKVCFLDLLDMDSQFPGKSDGLITERIAHQLFSEIRRHATALINFHTMGPVNDSSPYTVSKIVPGASPEIVEKSFHMALSFGVKPNCRVDLGTTKDEMPGVTGGTLDSVCMRNGILAFMAEMGVGGRREVKNVAIAQKGIYNVMRFLGIRERVPEAGAEQIVIPRRKFLRNLRGGLVEMLVRPGDIVKKGDIYARVINMWEVLEEMKAEEDMFMIGVCANPVVSSGDRIGFAGFDWYSRK
jgi:uncharacterized protein